MLRYFYKNGYQVVDESIVKLRRFSIKYSTDLDNDFTNNEEIEKQFPDASKKEKKLDKDTYIIKCKRSSFNFYENQTYSKFQIIPLASRGWQHKDSRGDYFTIYPVKNENVNAVDKSKIFKDIILNQQLVTNLENLNFIHPTHIQVLSIPKILNGKNIIITAETGCGKTFAFLLPLLYQISNWKPMVKRKVNSPLGLILTPSHDLTLQICSEAKKLSKQMDLKISSYIGGQTMKIAKDPPHHQVDLIIASLGVLSKLVTWEIYNMNYVRHIVLDEADVLLDPTFNDKLSHFIHTMPVSDQSFCSNPNFPYQVQLTLSSATIPENLPSKLHSFVKNNYLEPVVSGNQHQISVPQKFLRLKAADKPMELLKLIKAKIKSKIPIIIFTNTIKTCDFVSLFLKSYNIHCIRLHGDMPIELKRGKFNEFQIGICNILVTTDAGARGLDTIHVQQVINYDFPLISSEYIHRCGRTGRIGSPNSCQVINFISRPLEIILTSKIEFAIRKKTSIPMIDLIHNANEQDKFINSNSDNNNSTDSSDPFVEPSYRIPQ